VAVPRLEKTRKWRKGGIFKRVLCLTAVHEVLDVGGLLALLRDRKGRSWGHELLGGGRECGPYVSLIGYDRLELRGSGNSGKISPLCGSGG